jgi:hypothetical protein
MIDAVAVVIRVADVDPATADGYARVSGNDPRSVPRFVYIQLTPERMQVWRGVAEFAGRTVMRAGRWLDQPVD